jgi:hypothetical protein
LRKTLDRSLTRTKRRPAPMRNAKDGTDIAKKMKTMNIGEDG